MANTGYKIFSKLIKVSDDGNEFPLDVNNRRSGPGPVGSGLPQDSMDMPFDDPRRRVESADCPVWFEFVLKPNVQTVSFTATTFDGTPYRVNVDGVETVVNSNVSFSQTYGSPIGYIKITPQNGRLSNLKAINVTNLAANLTTGTLAQAPLLETYTHTLGVTMTGDVNFLPKSLKVLGLSVGGNLSGDIANLPPLMQIFQLSSGTNTISGTLASMPRTLTNLFLSGSNTLSGDISGIPKAATLIFITGNNTISGLLSGISDMTAISQFLIDGQNTIGGDINSLPSGYTISSFSISGLNTISGDVNTLNTGVFSLNIAGQNTVYGNIAGLDSRIAFFQFAGLNNITGDIATLKSTVRNATILGNNTVYGNIASLPDLIEVVNIVPVSGAGLSGSISDMKPTTYQFITSRGSLTGDISTTPPTQRILDIRLNNGLITYNTTKTWANNQTRVVVQPTSGYAMPVADIDKLFIDLDTQVASWNSGLISLTGTNPPPTSASQSARTSLSIVKGVVLEFNV